MEPTFTLRMNTAVTGLLRDGHRIVGVWYRTAGGDIGELRANLTVACDGRYSTVRAAAGLPSRSFGVPMDVWWYQLPRYDGDPEGFGGRFSRGRAAMFIDRGDYFQAGYLILKGADTQLRAEGIAALRQRIAGLLPWLADRVDVIQSWDDVKLLEVRLDRLPRWYTRGLLCIGDAAHAMSPVGGVGINLAVQDAVAAARYLADPLLRGEVHTSDLARVQIRRWLPTALTQTLQRIMHAVLVRRALAGKISIGDSDRLPLPLRLMQRFPWLQGIPALLFGIGLLPEHAPDFARRS
jgi:2-polyprenyl-6-methoxyphenol hydroxylase-like FAD-dependent oxidoreductase